MTRRVVVTGMGVVAPNASGLADFELALRKGKSGLSQNASMAEGKFGCRVAGVPQGVDELARRRVEALQVSGALGLERLAVDLLAEQRVEHALVGRPAIGRSQVVDRRERLLQQALDPHPLLVAGVHAVEHALDAPLQELVSDARASAAMVGGRVLRAEHE